jgi:FkbM family methyltransferase
MINFFAKSNHLINGLRSRYFRGGQLRNQLIQSKELVKMYPKERSALDIYKFFKRKFLFQRVMYNSIYDDAWSSLNKNVNDGIYHFGCFKFVSDAAFAFDFTGIFLCDQHQNTIDFNFNVESSIAKEVLRIIGTSEGAYTHENVIIEDDDVVIDAGANMGLFSVFASYYGAKMTYAFEPQSQALEIMRRNIALNSMESKVSIVEYGLSDKEGTVEMHCSSDFHASASIVMSLEGGETKAIHCITLDKWCIDNDVKKIDFIKADIEGAERLLLKGSEQILARFAPKLAICTYHLPDDKEVLTELILKANPHYKIQYTTHKLFAYVPK